MANDNGSDSSLWSVVREILEGATADLMPDAVATEAARRDPGLLRENESATDFKKRVLALLERRGLLDGSKEAGPVVRALTTPELRQAAGLSLEGRTATEHELASMALLGSRPSGAAAGCRPARPVPTAKERESAQLSLLDRAFAEGLERQEHERLAALLMPRGLHAGKR